MTSFSLVCEPWIPVVMVDGRSRAVGLMEVLTGATEIRLMADQSPLVTVALHRLLLALLYRIFEPRETSDWIRLWKAGRFDPVKVKEYLDLHRDRFDLLHPVHPFYQVTNLAGVEVRSVSKLIHEKAAGRNPTLFDHGTFVGEIGLDHAQAARYLLAYQQFAVAGGQSKPFYFSHGPLTAGYLQQARGDTLFQTLMLNLIPLDHWAAVPQQGTDLPAWERSDWSEPNVRGDDPSGPLGYLTWRSRRIRLVCKDGLVTGCQMLQGYALPESGKAVDPFKSYRPLEEVGYWPEKLAGDRAAWQYAHAMLAHSGSERIRSGLLDWLEQVQTQRVFGKVTVPPLITLTVSGLIMGDQAGKVEGWRREELPLPLDFLQDETLVDELKEALDLAWRTERLLRRVEVALTWAMAERKDIANVLKYLRPGKERITPPDSVKQLTRQSRLAPAYWPALEEPLQLFMRTLPEGDRSEVRTWWRKQVASAARAPYLDLREGAVRAGAPWEALGQIDAFMNGCLYRITNGEGVTPNDEPEANEETA